MSENLKIDLQFGDFPQEDQRNRPENYVLTPELQRAVRVAVALRQPLLITGEPGTGKTQLAYKVAQDLSKRNENFLDEPLLFSTKSGAGARDLFYTYDAVRHFHDANIKNEQGLKPTSHYIALQALGKAIALTRADEPDAQAYLPDALHGKPQGSVVLLDEIDKAPRDFPNDILLEIENYRFQIQETDTVIEKNPEYPIIVILTSNSEKNLPDAFLRRCVFYHIPFPDQKQLLEIVKARLGEDSTYAQEEFISYFLDLRKRMTKKKPATSELIAWLRMLEIEGFITEGDTPDFDHLTDDQKDILRISYSILVKTKDDFKNLET